MFGKEFFNWKLQNGGDYLYFGLIALCGIGFLYFLYLRMKKGRSEDGSKVRVIKKLNRHRPKNGLLFNDVHLTLLGEEILFDHLIIDDRGILPIKRFAWGTGVFGTLEGESWKIKDKDREELVPNPLLQIEMDQAIMTNFFGKQDIYGLHYRELVIMADTFDDPMIVVNQKAPVIGYKEIKKVMKQRKEMPILLPRYQQIADILMKHKSV